jgi:hypothetical protein
MMGMETAIPDISLNIQDYSSIRFTQGMIYPQRCFKQTIIMTFSLESDRNQSLELFTTIFVASL